MRIGELAELTGVSRRLLRYYEEQELIKACRTENGYRAYSLETADRVRQIRGLLDAGLSTRAIKQLLPCLNGSKSIDIPWVAPETMEMLERERDGLTARIDVLTRNRDAIQSYLDRVAG
ncbi:MerR family transcriptional regulator [Pseudonocardiaceae bacterium YIM PH 21723]|nr:MerR family transcriptional regulator [Pseudonocardiaceae bacterium YIM PH 21723]